MEKAVEIFAIVNLTVMGLSHIVQPRAWIFAIPGILFLVLAGLLAFHRVRIN